MIFRGTYVPCRGQDYIKWPRRNPQVLVYYSFNYWPVIIIFRVLMGPDSVTLLVNVCTYPHTKFDPLRKGKEKHHGDIKKETKMNHNLKKKKKR